MAALKVAFLQSALAFGGHERLVQSIALGLDRTRTEPIAVNLYGRGPIGEQLEAAGVPVVSWLARFPFDPTVGVRLRRVLRRNQVDVVYVADSAMPLFWAGALRRTATRPRLVIGFHSTGKRSDFLQHALANATALPMADRLVALAPSHRDYLCRAFRLDPGRFEVIPNGVDLERFRPAVDREAIRERAGLPASGPLVGIVAALRPEKDHFKFLAAAARVARRLPEARFAVIGEGPERAALEAETRCLDLVGAVSFLGGRDDVPELMRALDVAVLSSRPVVETFPVTLLEAAASGVPVVATRVGSVHEIVKDGETGYLVPSGNVDALADQLVRLLSDPARRHAMGVAARARAEREFGVERMVAGYERLFHSVAGED